MKNESMGDGIREDAVQIIKERMEEGQSLPGIKTGWAILKIGHGPDHFFDTIYTEEKTAKIAAGDMSEEFVAFEVKEVVFVMLPGGQALALGDYFSTVSGKRVQEYMRQRALAKLTLEDREALGLQQ